MQDVGLSNCIRNIGSAIWHWCRSWCLCTGSKSRHGAAHSGKTSVAAYVPALENALIFGGIFGCILAIFPQLPFQVGLWFLVVYGLASGVFLGCLAVALAEVLNVFPVLFRRANLKNGLGFLITAFAAGKTVGGLVYFFWIA